MSKTAQKAATGGSGRTMVLGMGIVVAGFAAFFLNMHRRQAQKEEVEKINPGGSGIPTWQHRILQQSGASINSDDKVRHASDVQPRSTPLPPNLKQQEQSNGHSTIEDYLASPNSSEEGRRMQPAPQRSRGDGSGRVYTKAPNYADSYEKTEKHWKAKAAAEKEKNGA